MLVLDRISGDYNNIIMPRTLSIIGSTGSIGTQALDIVRSRKDSENGFRVLALSAASNLELLKKQIQEFKPLYVSILDPEAQKDIKASYPQVEILENIEEIASLQVDIFLSAVVGIAGLKANLEALKHASRVAVANKETLVVAGHLVREYQKQYGSELIPVDSEHAAIHQALLNTTNRDEIQEIILTSSGGPFREYPQEKFKDISIEQALKHPTWKMGPKISIDSSTLMNKGLEVIEAHQLFDIAYDKISVLIHPQSIVHGLVCFRDANIIAQLAPPDMRIPIQYALDYPQRLTQSYSPKFSLLGSLEFMAVDRNKFPALDLAYHAGRLGHSAPTVLNTANEIAVAKFLRGQLKYDEIVSSIEAELNKHKVIKNPNLEDILAIDAELRTGCQQAFEA